VLNGGYVVFNGGTQSAPVYFDISNQATTGIVDKTPGTGWIISEGEFNQVKWEIQNGTGTYTVPFGYSTTNYIPVTIDITGAGTGSGGIKFATYGDLGSDNNTYKPSDVNNMKGACISNDSKYVLDRFWIIDTSNNSGAGYTTKPTSSITFTYTGAEINNPNTIVESKLAAQRYNTGLSTWWDWTSASGTDNSVAKTVSTGTIPSSDLLRSWTLVANKDSLTTQGNTTVCVGTGVVLQGYTGGTTYEWNTGATSSSISVIPLNTNNIQDSVAVDRSNGCIMDTSMLITVNPDPTENATGTATIITGQSTPLGVTNTAASDTYNWTPSTTLSCITCADPIATPTISTWYKVTVTNNSGCSTTDSVFITVKEPCGAVYIPNAFSPNGDGTNDILKVFGNCIQDMQLTIFDRWGNKVFESTNPINGWDGTFKGKPMNTGTYVFSLVVSDMDNNIINKKGNITLVR
jgi:gliding motility-associated-like protein